MCVHLHVHVQYTVHLQKYLLQGKLEAPNSLESMEVLRNLVVLFFIEFAHRGTHRKRGHTLRPV